MNKFILLVLPFIFLCCKSTKTISSSDIIPESCTNAVIFLKDHRLGNYNKQEYYYLDDVKEIRSIFSDWKDLKKMSLFPYHFDAGFNTVFDFYLIIDGAIQPCLIDGISPDGDMIKINRHGYEYKSEYWQKLRPKLKAAKKEERICSNAIEYRSTLEEIQKDKNYVFSESVYVGNRRSIPEKYDGYFYITAKTMSYSAIEKDISKAYPDADFRIVGQVGSGVGKPYKYQIYAKRELYEKFDLYPKDEYIELKYIKLTVYLKESARFK